MPPKPVPREEQLAHELAGKALIASYFDVPVLGLSLDTIDGRPPGVLLGQLEVCPGRMKLRVERYAMTLMASRVARLLCAEDSWGYTGRCTGQVVMERSFFHKPTAEMDRAFALLFAWVYYSDDGDTPTTYRRIWDETNSVLRIPGVRRELRKLARYIQEKRALDEDMIGAFFNE